LDLEKTIKRARSGDKESFVALVHHFEANLYRVAKAILKKDEDCADAIQETILKAYYSIHTLREPSFVKTWLIRILINECNQILRYKQKVIAMHDLHTSESAGPGSESVEIHEVVNRLEEDLRVVVTLYYFEDLAVKQIAELLGISEGTIKSRLYRARQALAKEFHFPEEGCQG
jgi:RNA polymerase sigma-70 factor (ECF subfamily)